VNENGCNYSKLLVIARLLEPHAGDKAFGMKKSSSDSYPTYECYVRFDVLMVVTLRITLFLHVASCSRADSYQSSEGDVASSFR
jgi:hypothetical protein